MHRLFCLLILVSTLAMPLHAQTVSLNDQLQTARSAMAQGRFADALAIADAVRQAAPYHAAMIRARSMMQLGQFQQAGSAIEEAITLAPRDSAARALKGIILLRQGRPQRAMLSLRRALDLAQTPQEKTLARTFVRQARGQLKWQFSGGFGLAPSTNINKATSADEITFLIAPGQAVLAPFTGQARSGTGLRLYGGVDRILHRTRTAQTRLSFGLSGNFYEDSTFSNQAGQIGLSHSWTGPRHRTSIALKHVTQEYDNTPFLDTTSITLNQRRALSQPGSSLSWSLGRSWQNRHDNDKRTNGTNRITLDYGRSLSPRLQWSVGLNFSDRDASSNFVAARHRGASTGLQGRSANGNWAWQGSFALTFGDWKRRAAVEPEIRKDQEARLSLSLQNNNISFLGLTPTYGISLTRRRSNLDRHDIRSTDMFIGVANAF